MLLFSGGISQHLFREKKVNNVNTHKYTQGFIKKKRVCMKTEKVKYMKMKNKI